MPNKDKFQRTDAIIAGSSSSGPAPVSRRALLKAGACAMPAILTLQSGAALARSSNLISAAASGTRDADGNTLCLDTSDLDFLEGSKKYDLGDPAYAKINVIPDLEYYLQANRSVKPPVGPDYVCQVGYDYYYHDRGWNKISLPQNGAIVSVAAIRSISSDSLNSIVVNYLQ